MQGKFGKSVWAFWPLRFVVLFALTMALLIGLHFLEILLVRYRGPLPRDLMLAIGAAIAVAVTVRAYRFLVAFTEQRTANELGKDGSILSTLTGMVIGVLLFTSVFISLVFSGAAAFEGAGAAAALMPPLASAASAAVGEEVIFRGVTFRLFEQGFGTTIAVLLSGALFGLLHVANPGATVESTIAIALEAGVLLAAAYALTRSLWFPIGLHFGWNFTEGGIFSTSVSGGKITTGVIATHVAGPNYLTGGLFGPEASLPAMIICLAAALVMLALAVQRGKWKSVRLCWMTAE